ncbi:1-acylglycerol-3-phosphate O-acyltransferase [Candidatus Erwinia haradaeae]|uniref:1-acyl-sn-glycerol-3-phosphate acyltransferase n=1 Tax=Candidatus Erwinia haradaeae TaxID=1922217 RepID=A0A451D8G2_9GAMM|nr:1-acylglycerol-3-phosphate O-acyltransferase [Candidatus Erwinia haradaeae]VFP82139.1 1-acyl-sn-glycerol-3-phosphate acyltransferase [Candidatus Erwinia haradaeae]
MLAFLRVVFILVYSIIVSIFGFFYCMLSPRNPCHVATFSKLFGHLSYFVGLTVLLRKPLGFEHYPNAIYICNHQNNFDMITAAKMVQVGTVTVGKVSVLWIPFFGVLYWLSGNILISRKNYTQSYRVIRKLIRKFKQQKISFWIFPEGTRSRGRGLLPFKMGAFYTAKAAGVPIIPVVVSSTHGNINLNRLKNGFVIVEMLPPIDPRCFSDQSVRFCSNYCRKLMIKKLYELNTEIFLHKTIHRRFK